MNSQTMNSSTTNSAHQQGRLGIGIPLATGEEIKKKSVYQTGRPQEACQRWMFLQHHLVKQLVHFDDCGYTLKLFRIID